LLCRLQRPEKFQKMELLPETSCDCAIATSTVAVSAAVLLLFIMLLEGMRPPASLAAPLISVSPGQLLAGAFNVQIRALEVTQGVRGDIPTRTAPGDDLVLIADDAVHVANRRTVVRAYPWVENGSGATVPPLTARLWAYRNGELLSDSPISPFNSRLEGISPGWTLEEMRGDAAKSWNFHLPQSWVTLSSEEESFTLRLVVEANPPGVEYQPECEGCDNDNAVILPGQEFSYIPPLHLKPFFVHHTFTDEKGQEVAVPGPTPEEFSAALNTVHRLFPIGDGARGMTVLPPTSVTWKGPLRVGDANVFAEAMIRRFLPDGSLDGGRRGTFYLFLFSPSEWCGTFALAWVGKSYVQTGTCGFALAHELTHAIGLHHAGNEHGEAGGGSFNPDYPDANGRVESNAYGFDLWSMRAIPPDGGEEGTYDYMSYGPQPQWVSVYTWKQVARLLGT
jgi:hypothetical protein